MPTKPLRKRIQQGTRTLRNTVKRALVRRERKKRGQQMPTAQTIEYFEPFVMERVLAEADPLPDRMEEAGKIAKGPGEFFQRMSLQWSEVSRAQTKTLQKTITRINARSALDGIGEWNPKTRRRVLRIFEQTLEQLNYYAGQERNARERGIQAMEARMLSQLQELLGTKRARQFIVLFASKKNAWSEHAPAHLGRR